MGGPRVRAGGAAALVVAASSLSACGEPPPPAPSAVIALEPSSVCLGDDFQTLIRLDASESAPTLTLVPVAPEPDDPPLRLHWSFSGAEHRVVEGDVHSVELGVTTAGDRPLHVALEVENAEGGSATTLKTVAITLPGDGGPCPDGA